jgi:CRP/FNR family transcriptional regulator, anaerobic regulatory protein
MVTVIEQTSTLGVAEGFPFLAGASAATRELVTALPVRQVAPRSPVLHRGDAAEGVFLVVGGSLRVFYIAGDGHEATLYRVRPGQTCILALSAAFRSEPYPAWVETEDEQLSFVLVPGAMFRQLYNAEPTFRSFVFEVLSGRVFELMARLEELGSLRVEQRLAAFLLEAADANGEVAMSQARLAAHLGTAREVVFRALKMMSDAGLVATSRGRVRLLDVAGLRRLHTYC